MESKQSRIKARAKSKHFKEEDKAARTKAARGKEITQEIITHALVYRNWLTRVFEDD